jgi:predicted lipase
MATLITSWAASQSFISNFKLAMYTFAGPTVGNVTFAGTFNARMLSLGAASHRIVNTKDVVPYAWSELQTVLDQNIPDSIPGLIRAIIQTAIQTLQDSHIVYKHVDFKQTLPTLDPVGCGTPGQYGTYVCWVEFEHSSSTYLRLLGVDTINWSGR